LLIHVARSQNEEDLRLLVASVSNLLDECARSVKASVSEKQEKDQPQLSTASMALLLHFVHAVARQIEVPAPSLQDEIMTESPEEREEETMQLSKTPIDNQPMDAEVPKVTGDMEQDVLVEDEEFEDGETLSKSEEWMDIETKEGLSRNTYPLKVLKKMFWPFYQEINKVEFHQTSL
jgi:hypothetical protein